MRHSTRNMNRISEKYGVVIRWREDAAPVIDVETDNMVVFHRVVSEMSRDRYLADAVMVMARSA